MKLGEMIKKLMNENDITLSQLSRATDIPRQTLDNWVSGQEPRSLDQLKRVADYFDVSIDYICFGAEKTDKQLTDYNDEINAGVFEVVLRRVKGSKGGK